MDNKIKRLFVFVLTVILCFTMVGCENSKERKCVYIIAKGSDSSFWHSVKSGADVASVEHNVDIVFTSPKTEEDGAEQARLIEEAIEKKANAIMLSAIDFWESEQYVDKAINSGIPVVIFDSGTHSNRPLVNISIDDEVAGSASFLTMRSHVKGKINIGIINFLAETDNGQKREKGFRKEVAKDGNAFIIDSKNVPSNVESSCSETKIMLSSHPEINAIVTFNEWTTLGVGKAINELGLKDSVTVVGFDNNKISIGHLEMGIIDSLIVQNPYAMGYLGVENAVKLINGKIRKKTVVNVKTVTATRENMYDKDIAELLFPFNAHIKRS